MEQRDEDIQNQYLLRISAIIVFLNKLFERTLVLSFREFQIFTPLKSDIEDCIISSCFWQRIS